MRAATVLLSLCLAALPGLACAQTSAIDVLPQLYARYLADGRSDVEIHLSPAGRHASARLRPQPDGSFSCQVSGLRPIGTGTVLDADRLALAGLLIHEVTHCLVGPHLGDLRSDAGDPASVAADQLLLLSAESISDARAVIEVFRRDGAAAAQALVDAMLPQRLAPIAFGHSTAVSMRNALALTAREPPAIDDPVRAFAAALQIGRDSAMQTLASAMARAEALDALASPAFKGAVVRLEAALARSLRSFASGRYTNDAATLRASHDAVLASDVHIFVAADGSVRRRAVVSAEGAHGLAALLRLIEADDSTEHRLAVQWLRHEGRLDRHSLVHTRAVIARFIRSVGGESASSQAAVARTLRDVIGNCRPGEGLETLLDSAEQRLSSERVAAPG